jgi:hypothetical protein
MISARARDFLILIGHAWICSDCRHRLLEDTEAILVGHKVSDFERERLMEMKEESFRTMMDLAAATGLTDDEVSLAVDHPRSRLRHLGRRHRR